MPTLETIRLRGVRQNNLKGFDLDVPLGRYVVVTGLSGAGKSSLVFDTLHAEGQRRYVETFSAYTRQFLELLAKPQVDSIENIRPSIAIQQSNTVKTSRSTVGTMTELCDYFKVWFGHVAQCFDPQTGERIEDDNPQTIWAKASAAHPGTTVLVAFRVDRPENMTWPEILQNLQGQSYQRVLIPDASGDCTLRRVDELLSAPSRGAARQSSDPKNGDARESADELHRTLPDSATALYVVQDRIALAPDAKARFTEAVETALHFGRDEVFVFGEDASTRGAARQSSDSHRAFREVGHYSRGLHSPKTGRRFRPASAPMFSFNSPLGACPKCRGFGRVIDIDYRLAIPDQSLSIDDGAIKCWEGEVFSESKRDLLSFAKKKKLPTKIPFADLTPEQQAYVIDGEPGYGENGVEWPAAWYGLKGFFKYLEARSYKMHYRVFLSRYRAYNLCPDCHGSRLQPEALCWQWQGRTLPELYQLPVSELLPLLESSLRGAARQSAASARGAARQSSEDSVVHQKDLALDAILARLRYLQQVGLGYLTLDRQSRTLSGGEVERVNLTSCLGSSLVDTLFVLDEPSVGLHPRDIDRLIGIIRSLTDAGNTVVVVEHDEAMIRAADHVIEIGPEPGAAGGHVVFQGDVPALLASHAAITGDYLSGRKFIPVPDLRRPVDLRSETRQSSDSVFRGAARQSSDSAPAQATTRWLVFEHVSKHNLRDLSFRLPLGRLVAFSGVSGSGKSTLLDHVVHQGLLAARRQFAEDPAEIGAIHGTEHLGEIVLVDQSPLSRTPRSNAALYADAWDSIRNLFATTDTAREAGYSASSFSFNAGDGRCPHCNGLGYEAVEMQFLSDVYVPCPICEGRRFKPEILACTWQGRSVADVLALTVREALEFFAEQRVIHARLAPLATVGLGYLALGQPLNTLSGGEAQRLKLVKYLGNYTEPTLAVGASLADARPASPRGAARQSSDVPSPVAHPPSSMPRGALLLLDEPTTGLHRHDVGRLLQVLHALVNQGHSVVVIEHNTDILKNADWIIEVGPEGGAGGGRIVAEGTPEQLALTRTATAPYLRAALAGISAEPTLIAAEPAPRGAARPSSDPAALISHQPSPVLSILGARENNLRNLSLSIALRSLTVVTGVSGSGKSTLAFDIVFAEGQRRFMESMSPYARQFVEQLPRPAVDRVAGIPPTVAIEQRITRGGRKSTVATITEVAQYLRLLYAKLGIQHHPVSGAPVRAFTGPELEKHFLAALATPAAKKAKHLYLCAPLVRGRKGHHQPIADWIRDHGYTLMRADGRLLLVENFSKLDRFKEHNVEVVVADLKNPETGDRKPESRTTKQKSAKHSATKSAAVRASTEPPVSAFLSEALRLGKGTCFLLLPSGEIISWFSTTRTDAATGETFPELDPKDFSFNSPKGWCPVCRGHGRLAPWMLKADKDGEDTPPEIAELAHLFDDESGAQLRTCPECAGTRLNRISRSVHLYFRHGDPLSLPGLLALTPSALVARLRDLELDARGKLIVRDIVPQIEERLKFMDEVGLAYLELERSADTLSGGEAQRIRLASQLGSNLSGVLYVLDEPSIGLHPRDNDRLIATLERLRAKGNTLLVVEHDDAVMDHADRIIDLGPGAGRHGGQLLADDTPANLRKNANSLTGLYLDKGIPHPIRGEYRPVTATSKRGAARQSGEMNAVKTRAQAAAAASGTCHVIRDKAVGPPSWLELTGARLRNLKSIDLKLPLGRLIMVAGPSGAGKSTLFRDLLHPAVACAIQQNKPKLTGRDFLKLAPKCTQEVSLSAAAEGAHWGAAHESIDSTRGAARQSSDSHRPSSLVHPPFDTLTGATTFKSIIEVDQSPIGHTPRSTPATYLGVFDLIRQFFATIPESKIRGYSPGRFSFNTAGGRCETCSGAGRVKLEMNFMPDTFVTCDACNGRRYGPELLEIRWKDKSVADILDLTFEEARDFFDFHSQLREVCALMCETGLGYLTLGQSSPTLSGGEAQRLKLVTELSRGLQSYKERQRGESPRNLYILEEPTIGLHLSDCEKLIHLLHRLVDQGHTVAVIEHHLDLLAEADWLIELGPDGGPTGGQLLYQGPVSGLAKLKRSPTAPYLKKLLRR